MPPKEKQTLAEVIPAAKRAVVKEIQPPEEDKTLLHLLRFIIVAAIVVVFGLIFVAWGTYSEGWQNYFVESVYRVVPYPAASVGYGNWITIADYNENAKAIRRFLENREAASGGGKFDFSTADGLKELAIIKKNVLTQLVDNKIIEVLAKQQGITVSNAELEETTNKILDRDGKRAENIAQLNSLYNWEPKDFKERVIKNLLYEQKLEDKIKASGELDKDIKEKVAAVSSKLASGEDFSEVAKNYSESPSKQYGGLLPSFSREDAPSAFANQAFSMKQGEISLPIESEEGWHFIKIERKFQEGGKDKVEIRHIVLLKKTLQDWLQEKKKEFRVHVFLKPYHWHDQVGKLYFKDDSLNKLEQEQSRNSLEEKLQQADFLLNVNKNTPKK